MTGRPLADAGALILGLPQQADSPEDRSVMTAVVASMLETLVERFEDRIVLAGTANLTRYAVRLPVHDPAGARGARGTGDPAQAVR